MNQYPQGIPDGILREDVVKAVRDFDAGADYDFGPSTFYYRCQALGSWEVEVDCIRGI